MDVKQFWNLSLNRALDLELLYNLVLCFINLYDLDWALNCLESPFSNLQNETDANSCRVELLGELEIIKGF